MAEDLIVATGTLPEQHLLRGGRSVMFAPVGDGGVVEAGMILGLTAAGVSEAGVRCPSGAG